MNSDEQKKPEPQNLRQQGLKRQSTRDTLKQRLLARKARSARLKVEVASQKGDAESEAKRPIEGRGEKKKRGDKQRRSGAAGVVSRKTSLSLKSTSSLKSESGAKSVAALKSVQGGNSKASPEVSSNSLAPVQRLTLEFLRDYIREHGYAPTLRDIADFIGVKSPSTAHFHLERLEGKGFIRRGQDGSIELFKLRRPKVSSTAVPLVGVIAAGIPIDAIENKTMIELPPSMIEGRGEIFCLEVSGDSMIDAHICDGDLVVIKKQDYANDGEIVAALLTDGSATLKTFRRLKNGKVMLVPANSRLSPITLDEVQIQGKVVAVMRQMM